MLRDAQSCERLCWRAWPCPKCDSGLTALGVLVRSTTANPVVSANEPEKLAAEQIAILQEWVAGCTHRPEQEITLPKLAEGSEHSVFLSGSDARVFKRTLRNTFGESYYLVNGKIHKRNCSPLDYLNRLRLWKKIFRSAPTSLGISATGQIISVQAYISGTPPTQEEVDAFLSSSNLIAVRQECFLWKKEYSDFDIWLGDTRDENFVSTKLGIVPIDVRVWFSSKDDV